MKKTNTGLYHRPLNGTSSIHRMLYCIGPCFFSFFIFNLLILLILPIIIILYYKHQKDEIFSILFYHTFVLANVQTTKKWHYNCSLNNRLAFLYNNRVRFECFGQPHCPIRFITMWLVMALQTMNISDC